MVGMMGTDLASFVMQLSNFSGRLEFILTIIMAKDALTLLDYLGWNIAHVFCHSMGSMIACKLAVIAHDRLLSLALLNETGGGFECFPKDVNAENAEKNTPRHWACLNGHIEVVKTLILGGAAVSALNSHERTPMDEAVNRGKMEVVDVISTAIAQLELQGVRVS